MATFLSYVQEEYDIDYAGKALRKKGTDFVIQRETPESFALPKNKAKAKTKVLRHPVAEAPCAGGCTIFNKQGSNASHIRLTCTVCRNVTSTRRVHEKKFSPETCMHETTTSEGSSVNTHRVWCRDCHTTLEENPQQVYRDDKKAFKEKMQRGELLRRDVDREPISHDVNRAQVQNIMRAFHALVTAHISHLDAE